MPHSSVLLRTRPKPSKLRRGMALLITIVLLAFLVLIVVGLASVTRVETQVASNNKQLAQARQNALFALNVAIGQLQKHAGPDQRVTAPATTVFPRKNVTLGTGELYDDSTFGYRSKALTSSAVSNGTYLTPDERTAWDTALQTYWNASRSPRYTAVFDTSLRVNQAANPAATPTALDRQLYGDANNNGSFGESGDYSTLFGEFKRDQIPVWLVSGVEKYLIDQAAGTVVDRSGADKTSEYLANFSPDSVLPDPNPADPANTTIWLVNERSATLPADSSDGIDGRVKVRKQEIKGPTVIGGTDETIGHYAYWVGDESQKANFAVRDPYSATPVGSVDYRNRLQVPQRLGWERMQGFAAAALDINSTDFLKVLTPEQIPLLDTSLTDQAATRGPVPRNFHHLTSFSHSLLTDTALGGLKKDLTVSIEGGSGGPAPTTPLLDRNRYAANDPRFGQNNTGFPATDQNVATWQDLLDWSNAAASGVVRPGRAPVLASYQMFFGFTYEDGKIQLHMVPCVALWNPYDTELNNTTYRLKWRHNFALWRFGMATQGLVDPTPADPADGGYLNDDGSPDPSGKYYVHQLTGLDWYNSANSAYKQYGITLGGAPITGTAPNQHPEYRFAPFDRGGVWTAPEPSSANATWVTYQLQTSFEPGQVKVFTIGAPQKINSPADLHTGTAVVNLVNDFDPTFPSSYFFDIATVGAPLPADTDFTNGSSDGRVRFYGEVLLNETPKNMSMSLATSGGTELWRSEYLGDPGGWGVGMTFSWTALDQNRSLPQTWRSLYPRNTWETTSKNASTGASRHEPLISMYRGRIEPFTPHSWQIFSGQIMTQDGATSYQRAFATYNLMAPNTDLDLRLEGSRARDTVNNTDRFTNNRLYKAEGSGGGNANDFQGWSGDSGGPYNLAQASGSDTEGFALLTWRSLDASTKRVKGISRLPLRQASRASANLLSIGQFQQANLSRFAWQPSFPLGNSEATPYVDRARVAGIESYTVGTSSDPQFGAHPIYHRAAGAIPNTAQNKQLDLTYLLNENLWDSYFFSSVPQSGNFATYDPATGLTGSSGTPAANTLLPNSRHRVATTSTALSAGDLRDFETTAAHLYNFGALNINTTSVEAWKSLLTAFRGLAFANASEDRSASAIENSIPVSRTIEPTATALGGGNLEFTDSSKNNASIGASEVVGGGRNYQKFINGFRYLTDDMIETLAERIVDEVRLRGPFLSLSDFVNRRLVAPDGAYAASSAWRTARTANQSSNTGGTHSYGVKPAFFAGGTYADSGSLASGYNSYLGLQGINGALQRAINVSGINGGVNYPLSPVDNNDRSFRVERNPTQLSDGNTGNQPMQMYPSNAHYLDTEHLAGAPAGEVGQLLSHSPGFVTQGDLLALLGPALTPRGDTFLIRTYGDAVNPATGELSGRAWLEAVVQRVIDPVTPAGNSGADKYRYADAFGRKFEVISFRWLSEDQL